MTLKDKKLAIRYQIYLRVMRASELAFLPLTLQQPAYTQMARYWLQLIHHSPSRFLSSLSKLSCRNPIKYIHLAFLWPYGCINAND